MAGNIDFLKDEVRSGFYIPTAIKQAWSAQLAILSEIDRVCEKYKIEYFADWGTYLGTVRHGGFVPWDDDMDICMKREGYELFKKVAKKELPSGYAIHDYESKKDHWLFLSRVVNTNQICFDKAHLDNFNNFPYIATVDIFVLDYLYDDEALEKERCDEVKYIIAVADSIAEGRLKDEGALLQLKYLEDKYNTYIDKNKDAEKLAIALYKLAEKQMARVDGNSSERIGQIFPWVLKGGKGFPKSYYENIIKLPFEYISMPVPAAFHDALRRHYGDYFTVRKVWTGHDYPYFEGQRANLQAVADFKLPEFTFDYSMFRENASLPENDSSLKALSTECLAGLENIVISLKNAFTEGDYDTLLSILPEGEQLAVDLGTLIENVKGNENIYCKPCVASLEEFCNALFAFYESITNELETDIQQRKADAILLALENVKAALKANLFDIKEVLFVATGAERFIGYTDLYEQYKNDENADVYVVAAPVMKKDILGQIVMTDEEIISAMDIASYPDDVQAIRFDEYNVSLHNPDIIYIQDPYDAENPCLTIPPDFYAKNLRQFTDELIYVPYLKTADFSSEDINDIYNMKHYVTAPGVTYADKIILSSETIRKRYIEKLTDFAGEGTKGIWEKKIICKTDDSKSDESAKTSSGEKQRKKMLFCISIHFVAENREILIEKLKEKFETFKKFKDGLSVDVCMYPHDEKLWEDFDVDMYRQILAIICENDFCSLIDIKGKRYFDIAPLYDAYYGGASPLVHSFNYEGKPVMIADMEI